MFAVCTNKKLKKTRAEKTSLFFETKMNLSGNIAKIKETQHITCKKAVFRDKENLVLQIDGNVTDKYNEYCCEIVENGINMYR